MNEEQMKFFALPLDKREKVFLRKFPDGKLLKKKLLAIGGDMVIWVPKETHLSSLVKNGRGFGPAKRKKTKGEVNGCHANVARLFMKKGIDIATGYALNGDRWIQHSWGWDGNRIVETTCLFDAYYGIILSGIEISKFVVGQLGDELMKLPREQLMRLPLPEGMEKAT